MEKNGNTVKQVYENVSCCVIEVETQGVICASADGSGGGATGGLGPYGGGAL